MGGCWQVCIVQLLSCCACLATVPALPLLLQPFRPAHPSSQTCTNKPTLPQGDLGLNICEAHAFNTKDRFTLDVFVVNGWAGGGTEELEDVLSRRLQELPPPVVRGVSGSPPPNSQLEQELRVPQVGGLGWAGALGCAWVAAVLCCMFVVHCAACSGAAPLTIRAPLRCIPSACPLCSAGGAGCAGAPGHCFHP